MKNIMKNNTILKALTGILFVSVLTVGAFTLAPAAHAQEWDGGDYIGGCCGDTGSYTESIDYPAADQGSYTESVDYAQPQDYSYDTSYDTGYSMGGYSTGGYGYSTPVYSTPSNVYAPTTVTTNTCTGVNNCNTDDHSVVNISNPAPVFNNVIANYGGTQTQTQYCASGYYGTYPNCYLNYQQPIVYQQPRIAYAATPYVSLSQVPYTGLDLGFWGTIAYWGAFVLFALFVAYLIAIKRVQNSIALKLKHFLFGTPHAEYVEESAAALHATPAQARSVEFVAAAQSSEDVIDSFIMSQINRPRRA